MLDVGRSDAEHSGVGSEHTEMVRGLVVLNFRVSTREPRGSFSLSVM